MSLADTAMSARMMNVTNMAIDPDVDSGLCSIVSLSGT